MPLVGTICCQTGQPRQFGECFECAREMTCEYPLALLKYMGRNEELRKGVQYSATSIIGCARQQILQKHHDYYEDPHDAIARFAGDAQHELTALLLADEVCVITEERHYRDIVVDGHEFTLSSKPDQEWTCYDRVVDLKNSGKIPKEPRPEHEAQVNIYAWVLDRDIDTLYITYVSAAEKNTKTFLVPVWSNEKIEDYIRRQLRPYIPHIEKGILPDLLPAYIRVAPKSGKKFLTRDWRCDWCPVRVTCDKLAQVQTGVDPNSPAYFIQRGLVSNAVEDH